MLLGRNFNKLETNESLGYFVSQYKQTPQQFMEYYKESDYEQDLKGKVVVAVECDFDNKPVNILGLYYPRENQTAKLEYYGHIAFITIKNESGDVVELLSKDDECMPQSFNEWFDMSSENHCLFDDYEYFSKEYVLNLINTVIKGATQDLNMKDYTEEDIIVLEGL